MAKKRAKKAPEVPFIYIIVPETVQILQKRKPFDWINTVRMEPGRLMAQCAHVARKLENALLNQAHWERPRDLAMEDMGQYEEITTIVLSVRNSRALERVLEDLNECHEGTEGAPEPFVFKDSNPEFYGTKDRVMTAVAVGPVKRSAIAFAIDYLELYGAPPWR